MILERNERVDWFRLTTDLIYEGHTVVSIAAAIDARKSTVRAWRMGCSPRFEDGARLIAFWCKVTGKGQDFVPKVNRYSYSA